MQISIHQAQTCLLELATRAAQGEKIIIAQDNVMYVELIRYSPKPSGFHGCIYGQNKSKIY